MDRDKALSVSQIAAQIKTLLEGGFPEVLVEGEVVEFIKAASGHLYFSLKDDKNKLKCTFFRPGRGAVPEGFANGKKVIARGRISGYAPRSEYQINVRELSEPTEGVLLARIEELKRQIREEGLTREEEKRPLPALPRRIALITSPTGAVIRDIYRVFKRRKAAIHILTVPATVQGPGAPEAICDAIDLVAVTASSPDLRPECLVIARGGGSLEDLMAFNTESVVRKIHQFRMRTGIPVISAIGHETDNPLSDYVADRRAATPTAAAEMLSQDQQVLADRVGAAGRHLAAVARHALAGFKSRLSSVRISPEGLLYRVIQPRSQRLDLAGGALVQAMATRLRERLDRTRSCSRRLSAASPTTRLAVWAEGSRRLGASLSAAGRSIVERRRSGLGLLAGKLDSLSPLSVLHRGYSIAVHVPSGKILTGIEGIAPGDELRVRLASGAVACTAQRLIEHPTP